MKVYGFGSKLGVEDPSPFVMKVITWLKMKEIPFEYVGDPSQLSSSPKGKLPYIEDEGVIVADSAFIFEYLDKEYGSLDIG
jgi:glutathione S-transferase